MRLHSITFRRCSLVSFFKSPALGNGIFFPSPMYVTQACCFSSRTIVMRSWRCAHTLAVVVGERGLTFVQQHHRHQLRRSTFQSHPPQVPIDMPLPPHPASYVPPEERDPHDESLSFLNGGKSLGKLQDNECLARAGRTGKTPPTLGPGQQHAPQPVERLKPAVLYMDKDAARVRSTSVHAGQYLLRTRKTVGMGEYYYDKEEAGCGGSAASHRFHSPHSSSRGKSPGSDASFPLPKDIPKRCDSIFSPPHEYSPSQDVGDGRSGARDSEISHMQLELDLKKLEYYQGTPQYPEVLRQFQKRYGTKGARRLDGNMPHCTELEGNGGTEKKEPFDVRHASPQLQAYLFSGPQALTPAIALQRSGAMRFQGYAFPPTVELGQLKDGRNLTQLQDEHRKKGTVAFLHKHFNALVDRPDTQEAYLATENNSKGEGHILYRIFGLDAVQRRQMRFMLTDFDYADRNTAFHVMMSYPYTDWVHAFYMILVGWCLYHLQVIYSAYEFYDEYLGLDLRQVPGLKKPALIAVTVFVMVFILFQPLLVASIATNRAYRIVMKRPIGPP